ncbi:MAG: pantoate--beta-alanine ligase [Armatimonadota bacterium]
MEIFHTIEEIREYLASKHKSGSSIGLVPTMGYFHEGHQSLMRRARKDNDFVVVSLFVNPIQFGPKEDLRTYPRDLQRDARMAEEAGVDVIFNPSAEEMYPSSYCTYVEVTGLTDSLCGASRPGHFRGVTTVVSKLFNIVMPDRAYFGMKDYQQFKVVERMTLDMNLPIAVVGMPTFREPDGLAMSSRNSYLNPDERITALILSRSLAFAQDRLADGVSCASSLKSMVEQYIMSEPLASIDYVEIIDTDHLRSLAEIRDQALLALAVKIGKTRLIDNAILIK